jgi:hypothetical protein
LWCGPPVVDFASHRFIRSFAASGLLLSSCALGVGHNPHPVASVRGVDGASRNNNRPRGVADTFQRSKTIVERHIDDSSNILTKHPTGLKFRNNAQHLRPEETVIRLASSLPGTTEWLAGKTAGNEPRTANRRPVSFCRFLPLVVLPPITSDGSGVGSSVDFSDIVNPPDIRPVFL